MKWKAKLKTGERRWYVRIKGRRTRVYPSRYCEGHCRSRRRPTHVSFQAGFSRIPPSVLWLCRVCMKRPQGEINAMHMNKLVALHKLRELERAKRRRNARKGRR